MTISAGEPIAKIKFCADKKRMDLFGDDLEFCYTDEGGKTAMASTSQLAESAKHARPLFYKWKEGKFYKALIESVKTDCKTRSLYNVMVLTIVFFSFSFFQLRPNKQVRSPVVS